MAGTPGSGSRRFRLLVQHRQAKQLSVQLRTPLCQRDKPRSQLTRTTTATSVGLLTGFIADLQWIYSFCNDNNSSSSRTNFSADANDDALSPFANISCAQYTRLQDEWAKRQTAGVSELPPLNMQQRKAGSDFLQLCILAGEFRRQGRPPSDILRVAKGSFQLSQFYLVVGGGGAGKNTSCARCCSHAKSWQSFYIWLHGCFRRSVWVTTDQNHDRNECRFADLQWIYC